MRLTAHGAAHAISMAVVPDRPADGARDRSTDRSVANDGSGDDAVMVLRRNCCGNQSGDSDSAGSEDSEQLHEFSPEPAGPGRLNDLHQALFRLRIGKQLVLLQLLHTLGRLQRGTSNAIGQLTSGSTAAGSGVYE